jgi:hypothetical protein
MSKTLQSEVVERLRLLHGGCGRPDDNYLGRCFDVLGGIAFSIIEADKWGFPRRATDTWKKWHSEVRTPFIQLLEDASSTGPNAVTPGPWADWISGFYFNSAAQRIIAVGERLTKIFAASTLECCADAPNLCRHDRAIVDSLRNDEDVRMQRLTDISGLYLEHLNSTHFLVEPLTGIRTYFELSGEKNKDHEVNDKNYFSALRWDVNRFKHSARGPSRLSDDNAVPPVARRWSELSDSDKFGYLRRSFECVCNYHADLSRAYSTGELVMVDIE